MARPLGSRALRKLRTSTNPTVRRLLATLAAHERRDVMLRA